MFKCDSLPTDYLEYCLLSGEWMFTFPRCRVLNFFLLLSLALFLFCKSLLSLFSYANEALRPGGLEGVF